MNLNERFIRLMAVVMMISFCSQGLIALANPPVIDTTSEVTSRDQIGVLQNNVVILCPGQSKAIDLSQRIPSRFTATARSRDERIAQAGIAVNRRNHVILNIQAGENDSNQDRITQVDVTATIEVLNVGIPADGEPGTGNAGRGIHGSGPDSHPHGVPNRADYTKEGTITVRVLAKSKCDALPQPPQTTGRIGGEGRGQRQRPEGKNVRVCAEAARRFDLYREITGTDGYPNRNRKVNGVVPHLENLQVLSNSNPNIATLDVYAQYDLQNPQQRVMNTPVHIVIFGLEPGQTQIKVRENPPPINLSPFAETYNVTVEACGEQARRAQLERAFLPQGYGVLPAPPRPERTWLDDELEEHSSTGGFKFVEDGFLARLESGDGALAVNCPADTQTGDLISCSVVTDEDQSDEEYVIEIATTAVIEDPEQQTSVPVEKLASGLFSWTVPASAASALIRVKDKAGHVVSEGHLPVKPHHPAAGVSQYSFPGEMTAGQPMAIQGAFPEPVSKSQVLVDGQQAQVLAKSPRSLVVNNPSETAGMKEVVLKEGNTEIRQIIPNKPAAVAATTPAEPEPARALNPMEQMMQEMCQSTVDLYKQNLKSMTNAGWKPPKPPSKGRYTAKLRYDLLKDGRLNNIQVIESSGYAPLDQSAVQQVQRSQGQFRPLPGCYEKPSMEIDHTFTLIYR